MNSKAKFFRYLLLGSFAWLAGCGGLLDSAQVPDRIFWIEPLAGSGRQVPDEAPGLVVNLVAVPGLDTDRLVTLGPNAELNNFSGAAWPDYLSEYLSSVLIRSLRASGHFSSVSPESRPAGESCMLELDLQRFFTRVDSTGTPMRVEVSISGNFSCRGGQVPLNFDEQRQVGGSSVEAVVAAHQHVLDAVSEALIKSLAVDS